MNSPLIRTAVFDGCLAEFDDAGIVLIGAGYDGTSSYRAGSRFGPHAIRSETLYSQETYSPYFEKDLSDLPIHDAGDIDLPIGSKSQALRLISAAASELFDRNKRPCFIGGEHLISLPVIEEAGKRFPDLCVVQIDAHLDLMDSLFGDSLSHGTVMRRAWECLAAPKGLYQLGIRSGSREEFQFAARHTNLCKFNLEAISDYVSMIGDAPVYLTIDLDVFDPSLLPGTGTPEAGGIFFDEYISFLSKITDLNIIACDIVELSPKIDTSGQSAIVAAKILRELLISL